MLIIKQMKNVIVLTLLALLLAACAVAPPSPGDGTAPIDEPAAPAAPAEQYPDSSARALDQLLNDALQRQREGDLDGAINQAERALRIAPRNARVYLVLGSLYLANSEPHTALQMARKARSLDREQRYYDPIFELEQSCLAAL